MSDPPSKDTNVSQHTVSRFYLNGFAATADKKVYVRDRNGATLGPVSTEPLSAEDYAYTIFGEGVRDDSCDEVNSNIETRVAPRIKSLSPDRIPTKEEWIAILFISANFLTRSRRTRDPLREAIQWAACIAEDATPILSANLADSSEHINRAASLLYPLTVRYGLEPVISGLKAKSCDLFTAPEGSVFVTSDDPAVVYVNGQVGAFELKQGFIDQPNVDVFIALKPNIAVCWHSGSSHELLEITSDEVVRRNQDVYSSCYTAAYSNCRDSLENLCPLDSP